MDKQIKISVVVPIYNVSTYLQRCINSLLRQDFENYEIILVDDCSTDDSAEIAKEYSNQYTEKIIFVQRDKNGGLSAARNSGMIVAKGTWINFVDSDDWVDDKYLSTLYNAALNYDADVVMCGVYYAYDNGKLEDAKPFGDLSNSSSKKEIIAQCRSYAWGRLFHKQLFLDNGILFPEEIRRSEDIGTIIPILTYSNKIALIQDKIYFYYQRATSISNSNESGVDLSFYPKTLKRMFKLSKRGYEEELEFRAIHEMLYGMPLLMIKSNKSKDEFIQHIEWFNNTYRTWKRNKYLKKLSIQKFIFIELANLKMFLLLKGLVAFRKYWSKWKHES